MIGITLLPSNGNNEITEINCGTSSPKLGGNIDLSFFPNLTHFTCVENDITSISGYENNPNLVSLVFRNNKVTGSIPSLNGLSNLLDFRCHLNQLTGNIPELTPSIVNFLCQVNQLSGNIPNLNACVNLADFQCATNQLNGNIPDLSLNTKLKVFTCHTNFLTGAIPSLSTNTILTIVQCRNNQLSGWEGGTVSDTVGEFQAQTNQLPSTAVNAILAAFVAANRTSGTRILNLGGTGNAAPTGQGLTDKQTLIDRGWTVTTN
jgi:hypothetical protein